MSVLLTGEIMRSYGNPKSCDGFLSKSDFTRLGTLLSSFHHPNCDGMDFTQGEV